MVTPDEALENLRKIIAEFKNFCKVHGKISEADTRANVIDKILTKVLDWDDIEIRREPYTDSGYMDYSLLVNGKRFITVEAKREGIPFILPIDTKFTTLKLNGSILTSKDVKDVITQVRGYCDDSGIRYAIATNGYAWIVFRAIREDMPWREGNAIVFHSLEQIEKNFVTFWNLISHVAVSSGKLDSEFGISLRRDRQLLRVTDFIMSANAPLIRNALHTELNPVISYIFEDIVHEQNLETLKECYVYKETQKIVASDINCVITDSIPKFLPNTTEQIIQTRTEAGVFGNAVDGAVQDGKGQLFLLLGGIGSGKTTFQKRYQLTVGKETLDKYSVWFSIDFLKAPLDPLQIEDFLWKTLIEQLRTRYSQLDLESRENIKRAYKYDLGVQQNTSLYGLKIGTDAYERKLSDIIGIWQKNLDTYLPKLLNLVRSERGLNIVLFIDNVDQLPPDYQANIFKLGERITRIIGSITIIALREESYYAASVQKIFTAYINRQFHIASPPFRVMIGKRINYFLHLIGNSTTLPGDIQAIPPSQRNQICDFLKIVEYSIFEKNKNIAKFIDSICFGNMRMALQLFSVFLTSGVTDVEKMLRIYKRDGNYFVPFHEFLKSVMLEDNYYYKDSRSRILNIFDCGVDRNSSHFTSIRMLKHLTMHRSENSEMGVGFVEIVQLSMLFENVFNNREDFIRSLRRLVSKQLIETNTKSTDNLDNATHIRVTSAGWYYQKFLVKTFCYLDLIIQDIPFNDETICRNMVSSVKNVGNKGDQEENKLQHMEERFLRVDNLLNYLEKEELEEIATFNLSSIEDSPITQKIIPFIRDQYSIEKEWIKERLRQNRERLAEERIFKEPEFDFELTQLDDDDDDAIN